MLFLSLSPIWSPLISQGCVHLREVPPPPIPYEKTTALLNNHQTILIIDSQKKGNYPLMDESEPSSATVLNNFVINMRNLFFKSLDRETI